MEGGRASLVTMAMTFSEKKCYQQVEAVLKEGNGKVDSVLIITNFVEKGGGDKTEIGWGFSVENFRVKQTVQLKSKRGS